MKRFAVACHVHIYLIMWAFSYLHLFHAHFFSEKVLCNQLTILRSVNKQYIG